MIAFLLWCVLFVLCWPVALVALVLYPLMWLFLLTPRFGDLLGRWRWRRLRFIFDFPGALPGLFGSSMRRLFCAAFSFARSLLSGPASCLPSFLYIALCPLIGLCLRIRLREGDSGEC